jgi:hypothetical protein
MGGKGFLLAISGTQDLADPACAQAFLETLAKEDISVAG